MSGKILWTPSPEWANASTMAQFERFIGETRGKTFEDYNAMWRWSNDGLEGFRNAIWNFFELRADLRPPKMIVKRQMPGME